MAWLNTWGSPLLASIVGVIAAAVFTWFFSYRAERKRRQGIRALVTREVWHNETSLLNVVDGLKHVLASDNGRYAQALRALPRTLHWHRSRWDLPDVGSAFSPAELTRLSEWYWALDGATFAYETLMLTAATIVELMSEHPADSPDGQKVHEVANADFGPILKQVITTAEHALGIRPTLPDPRIERDAGVQRYADELRARHAAATAPATAEVTQPAQ